MEKSTVYRCAVVLGLGFTAAAAHAQSVYYVDADATSPGAGTNWCTAFTGLQGALEVAGPGDTIRIADGVYPPDPTGLEDPREATFQLVNGVVIEGGYAGCGAPDPDERDLALYRSILSGDLNGDDGAGGSPTDSDCCVAHGTPGCDDATCEDDVCVHMSMCCNSEWSAYCARKAVMLCCELCSEENDCENSYHVVTALGVGATTVLDGLTITAGRAASTEGLTWTGGGMCNDGGAPTLINCAFIGNAAHAGGALCSFMGGPTFINCLFSGNTAANDGGAIFNDLASPTLTNCTLTGNSALTGGGIRNYAAVELTLTNCILWGNTAEYATGEAAQIENTASNTVVNYTCLEGWTGMFGGTGNTGEDPLFIDADGPDDTYGTADDNPRLGGNSPCLDAGDNAVVTVTTDLDGQPRIVNDTVDVGAYEFQGQAIPAVSGWALVITLLLLLATGTVLVRGHRAGIPT